MINQSRQRETSRPARTRTVPVVLTIAGSDNSGGAGLQADLKTFTSLGVYGATAVTCVVAEHPGRVLNITPLPPRRVADQIRLVLEAFPVAAIKTGMLYSAEIIRAVQRAIAPTVRGGVPLVIDPVMVASSGRVLLKPTAIRALRDFLPLATVVTPNRDEAALLWGRPITSLAELEAAARDLAANLSGPAILAKGGHLKTGQAVDLLATPEGRLRRYAAPRIPNLDPHGTGCTYSAAIAAALAKGEALPGAVRVGKAFINRALRLHLTLGRYPMLNQLP